MTGPGRGRPGIPRATPALYDVEEWEGGWAVVRDGFDLRDRREVPCRRIAALILYADQATAEQVAFLLNTQRYAEVDPRPVLGQKFRGENWSRGGAEKFGN